MKKIILLLILAANANGSWFDNGEKERRMEAEQRRIEAEQQLQQQRHETGGWQITAAVMAVGAVTLFTIGTALGAKARRDANKS